MIIDKDRLDSINKLQADCSNTLDKLTIEVSTIVCNILKENYPNEEPLIEHMSNEGYEIFIGISKEIYDTEAFAKLHFKIDQEVLLPAGIYNIYIVIKGESND